ncbi:MAG: 4-hydroxy-tetrahydrodipicolinate reductase [Ignavibacteria bacterium]|nr:4-hydroxy-tetrahydrodipicolinate reductase [Ignavibacteria bacterium]
MNIALIGYGRMGKEVEAVASERAVSIGAVFTRANNRSGSGLTAQALKGVDVCIDFSAPEAVVDSVRAVAAAGIDLVVGTTGWDGQMETVRSIVSEGKIGFICASNFSPGVNLMMKLVREAGRLFDRHDEYDVAIHETHHSGKADSPSGTALTLASELLGAMKRKREMQVGNPKGIIPTQNLHVSSTRVGSVAGIHKVQFDSPFDSVELIHTARSRRGFASGALHAAEWIQGKKGFYTINDLLDQ